ILRACQVRMARISSRLRHRDHASMSAGDMERLHTRIRRCRRLPRAVADTDPRPWSIAPYGLLLWITTSSRWIPVIILQPALASWVIDRALKIFGLRRSPWVLPFVVAVIAATSGLAFFVSQVLPDAWAAPAVLALHLLAWHADSLTRMERAGMTTIVAFAGASHMATLGLLVGLSIVQAVAWLARR